MTAQLMVRSCYSLLDGTMSIKTIVQQAKSNGYSAVALTDFNVLFGMMEFYKECKKQNIKPIFGIELSVKIQEEIYSTLVYAKNYEGYKEIITLSSIYNIDKKEVSLEDLSLNTKECICVIYGEGGPFEPLLLKEDSQGIFDLCELLKEKLIHFYVGLSENNSDFWKQQNQLLKKQVHAHQIKTVALDKVYYNDKEDYKIQKLMLAIQKGYVVDDRRLTVIKERHFKQYSVLKTLYDQDDLDNIKEICDLCNIEFSFDKASLPKFKTNTELTSKEYLNELCKMGLKKRFNQCEVPHIYIERLKYELDMICQMNYEDYFLIVWDFIRFSRKNNIYVGPGRGSSAGSLVAYVLGIVHVDPIKYNLLFERFLNPERVSMPDIDIDFPDNRRDEVIDYVYQTYGANHVAHISTFGTFGAKQAIRDVGRVLNIPIREVDMISKSIPFVQNITLMAAFNESSRFKKIILADKRFEQLFQYALKIEGLPRHISTHAAGIVMSHKPLDNVVPLIQIEQDMSSTQYTMEHLEQLGLIKMDFLGLKNLTIIDEVVSLVNRGIDILKIPLNDQKTFKLLQDVDTVGIFQLESEGMKSLIRKMKPRTFDDIVATIALFRPGPMENIPQYLSNRENPSSITYLHDDLKAIVQDTFGILIYQEQIMQVAQKMAGFRLSKADILRKAMSKKNVNELVSLQKEFIDGCISKGYTKQLAIDLYELILKFANYGFNKSHSVAYGLIAYQMAYLKANYPLEFYTCLLSSAIQSEHKTNEYLTECTKRKVIVLPPSINDSTYKYEIENSSIRFPLLAIKGIGINAVAEILKDRNGLGKYEDYYNCISRLNLLKITNKMIESLIYAGAFDEFGMSRSSMIASLNEALIYANLVSVDTGDKQTLDFGLVSKPIPIIMKDFDFERLENEKNVLGFYLSSHPIIYIKKQLGYNGDNIAVCKQKRGYIQVLGMITRVKLHRTKKGDQMAFVNIMDESGQLDLAVMPTQFNKYQAELIKGNYIVISGKIESTDSCLLNQMKKININ